MERERNNRRFFGQSYKICLPLLVLILLTACVPQTPGSQPVTPQPGTASGQVSPLPEKDLSSQDQNQALLIRPVEIGNNGSAPKPLDNTIYQLETVDLGSGEPVEGMQPIVLGSDVTYSFSPDRSQLAVVSKGAGCSAFCLRVYKLENLQQTVNVEIPKLGSQGYVNQFVYDQTGKRLAISYNEYNKGFLSLVDISRQESPSLQTAEFPYSPSRLAFAADSSKLIMVAHLLQENFSTPAELTPRLHALSLDVDTMQITWDQTLTEVNDGFFGSEDSAKLEDNVYYQAGIAVDASSQKIYLAHADAEKLTIVNFKTKSVNTETIHEKKAWLENFIGSVLSIGVRDVQAKAGNTFIRQALLSADGRTLYVVGYHDSMIKKDEQNWDFVHSSNGLSAWDIDSGTIILKADTQASEIRQGINGEIFLSGYNQPANDYPFTEIFDPSSGEITAHLDRLRVYPSLRTDGTPVLVSAISDYLGSTDLSALKDNLQKPEILWTRTLSGGYAFWPEYH